MKANVPAKACLAVGFHKKKFKHRILASIIKRALVIFIILAPFQLIGQGRIPIILYPQFNYASPQVYTVGTSITPLAPNNAGGAVPAPGTYTNPQTLVTAGTNEFLSGVCTDSQGNAYFGLGTTPADNSEVRMDVYQLTPGSSTPGYTTSSYYLGNSVSLGMDPLNNLFMNTGAISELIVGTNNVVPIGDAHAADGVACSAAGFIYAAGGNSHLISEFTRNTGGTGYQTPITFSSALSDPVGVAVDGAGNVFAVDNTLPYVTEFKANGTVVHLGSGLSSPWGIVLDAAGDIFVGDSGNAVIKEYPAGGSAFITIGPGTANALTYPKDVAVDPTGSLYIIDWASANSSARTLKYMKRYNGYTISPALPAGLSFNAATGQISGTPTQTSPTTTYTITAANSFGTGSATLTITVNLAAPKFSYNTPNIFSTGIAIKPLSPTNNNGVTTIAYGNSATNQVSIGSGFTGPISVAADNYGNAYVPDNSTNLVYEVLANNGGQVTLGSGFVAPTAVAVDNAGNIYVAESGENGGDGAVKKMPPGGGAPVTIATGFDLPFGLAVDAAGNVYVSDQKLNTVTKIPVGGGAKVNLGSGFNYPEGLALDGAGNLYVTDYGNNVIKEIPVGGGDIISIGTGLYQPLAVAVDAAGNLYVADYGNQAIKYIAPGAAPVVISTATSGSAAVAINGAGTIFIACYDDGTVSKINPAGGFFAGPDLPVGLSFNSTTGSISGTPTVNQTAANYVISGYNTTGGSAATVSIAVAVGPAISYQTPQTYILGSAITPLKPASLIIAPQAYADTTVDLNAPGVTFVHAPSCLSIDKSGSLYVSQGNETYVTKIYKDNSAAPLNINIGFQNPSAIYVDAKNYLYLCNPAANSIVRVGPNGGSVVTLYSGLNNPSGIVLDASGNIYEADYGSNTINRFPAAGGTPVPYGTGFNQPEGLAFDAAGNLYVADNGNNAVKEVLAGSGSTITLVTGLSGPATVAVDATGNLFICDLGHKVIKELPAGSTTPITIGPTFRYNPFGLAVDQAGNVDVTGLLHFAVYQIQPSGGYYLSTALPAGLKFSNATGTISGTPTVVSPATDYIVTAWANGYGAQATVNITVKASSNANLAKLVPSLGGLTPAFAAATTSYTDNLAGTHTAITITPTAADPAATITVNGTAVASGAASAVIPLNVGNNAISTVVTAGDGVTKMTYTLTVNRAAPLSTNANLANLVPSLGGLSPAYAAATTRYTIGLANSHTSITFTPTVADATAKVTVNGTAVTSGTASAAIPLALGNNAVSIVVTAQDGVTKMTYTVTVNRAGGSTNANLAGLVPSLGGLSPAFAAATTSYTIGLANSHTSITLKPTTADPTATVTVNGTAVASGTNSAAIPLAVGNNVITTVVTAGDGVTKVTYTVTLNRAAPPSSNANLASITPSLGTLTPAFATGTTTYADNLANSHTSIQIRFTVADATATVTVNGTTVAPNTYSPSINLAVGNNPVSIVSTAQDGVTKITYTVNVNRAGAVGSLYVPADSLITATANVPTDGILVHPGVSPNGDGINDIFTIDGINAYPENKVIIMGRNGNVIFETKGYDNQTKFFDGHSSKNGSLQLPGTYFYSLEYSIDGKVKQKTGFLVLKY